MGFVSAEEVTLPTRFVTKTAHLLAVITIMFDIDLAARNSTSDGTSFTTEKKMLQGLLWTAIVCFIIEYVGLFLGVSMFAKFLNSSYIMLHFVGTILTTLFYTEGWKVTTFIPMVVFFNCVPGVCEGLAVLLMSQRR